jgi:hypothetical protein
MCCTPTRPPTPFPSHSALNKISNFNINQNYLIHAYTTLCHNKYKLLKGELRYISSDFPGDIEQYSIQYIQSAIRY